MEGIEKEISKNLCDGDLILIIHKYKPEKSGWWRYIKTRAELFLERPIHDLYATASEKYPDSRFENEVFVMKANTVAYDINKQQSSTYKCLCLVRSQLCSKLVLFNFNLEIFSKLSKTEEYNVMFSSNFIEFKRLVSNKNKTQEFLLDIAEHYQL